MHLKIMLLARCHVTLNISINLVMVICSGGNERKSSFLRKYFLYHHVRHWILFFINLIDILYHLYSICTSDRLQKFAHVTTDVLSEHVPNSVAILCPCISAAKFIATKLELRRNNRWFARDLTNIFLLNRDTKSLSTEMNMCVGCKCDHVAIVLEMLSRRAKVKILIYICVNLRGFTMTLLC